jgi:hypothetical protein
MFRFNGAGEMSKELTAEKLKCDWCNRGDCIQEQATSLRCRLCGGTHWRCTKCNQKQLATWKHFCTSCGSPKNPTHRAPASELILTGIRMQWPRNSNHSLCRLDLAQTDGCIAGGFLLLYDFRHVLIAPAIDPSAKPDGVGKLQVLPVFNDDLGDMTDQEAGTISLPGILPGGVVVFGRSLRGGLVAVSVHDRIPKSVKTKENKDIGRATMPPYAIQHAPGQWCVWASDAGMSNSDPIILRRFRYQPPSGGCVGVGNFAELPAETLPPGLKPLGVMARRNDNGAPEYFLQLSKSKEKGSVVATLALKSPESTIASHGEGALLTTQLINKDPIRSRFVPDKDGRAFCIQRDRPENGTHQGAAIKLGGMTEPPRIALLARPFQNLQRPGNEIWNIDEKASSQSQFGFQTCDGTAMPITTSNTALVFWRWVSQFELVVVDSNVSQMEKWITTGPFHPINPGPLISTDSGAVTLFEILAPPRSDFGVSSPAAPAPPSPTISTHATHTQIAANTQVPQPTLYRIADQFNGSTSKMDAGDVVLVFIDHARAGPP